jgi:NADH-quinone oxidoreductase subunit H
MVAQNIAFGIIAAIAAVMFLGGWWVPGFDVDDNALNILGPAVMFVKIMAVSFVIFWVRFSFPRFREDQLQTFAWKFLIPLSLVNILATGILKVAF